MTELNRRALLMATPALAIVASAPSFAAISAIDRSEWDAAMRIFLAVESEDKAFMPGYRTLTAAFDAAVDRLPHVVLETDPHSGRTSPVTTADEAFVSWARRTVKDVREGRMRFDNAPELQAHYRVCQNVAEAADARDAQIQSIRRSMGIDELKEAGAALGDRAFEARWALMRIPAPDHEALLFKLEYLLDPDGAGGGWTEEALSQPVADMRRLLGEARA